MTLSLHSLFQSKMADGVDFLRWRRGHLEAILDMLKADEEMEEEFIYEVENITMTINYDQTNLDPSPKWRPKIQISQN